MERRTRIRNQEHGILEYRSREPLLQPKAPSWFKVGALIAVSVFAGAFALFLHNVTEYVR